MKMDSRLSDCLHVLIHLMQSSTPVTSTQLASALGTNPVVLRRLLSNLRQSGYVHSLKGHGGGWQLRSNPEALTLFDIYLALNKPPLFAIGNRHDKPGCKVEKAVNAALEDALLCAETLLLEKLKSVTLAKLANEIKLRHAGLCGPNHKRAEHGDAI